MDITSDRSAATIIGGRYEITGLIASGGMGSVYRARDTVLDRVVALKVLSAGGGDTDFVSRFRAEATNAARLSHPNIVQVYDFGYEDSAPYMAMEYVDGQTLRGVLAERRVLRPEQVARIGEQVAGALEHARRAGIVHRDIKPENILVTTDGHVKVADFGLSRALAESRATQVGMLLGTAHYLAPEQVSGGETDHRADIYALGVVLFEALTGRPPFSGDSPVVVAYKRVSEDVPAASSINPSVPPEMDAVVARATARDPNERTATAGVLAAELRQAVPSSGGDIGIAVHHTTAIPITGQETLVIRRPESRTARRRRRRMPTRIIAALAVLAALGGVLTVAGPLASVTVPYVTGSTQKEAAATLREAGLRSEVTLRNDDTVASGLILSQEPASGARARRGATVALIVSLGPKLIAVPSVIGMTFDEAVAALADRGFTEIRRTNVNDDTAPKLEVIGQDPSAGQELRRETPIALSVSQGPRMVRVPNVTGDPEASARGDLDAAGLKVKVQQEPDMAVPEGNVVSQDPAAGRSVRAGTTVTIIVSSGPPLVAVPNLECMTRKQAGQALEKAGLRGRFSGLGNRVVDQSPGPKQKARQGSTVSVTLGAGSFC